MLRIVEIQFPFLDGSEDLAVVLRVRSDGRLGATERRVETSAVPKANNLQGRAELITHRFSSRL